MTIGKPTVNLSLMKEINPIEKAVRVLGTQQALADVFGVKKQAVTKWRRRVPAERVLGIEQATNGEVTRHELRPDLYPAETAA